VARTVGATVGIAVGATVDVTALGVIVGVATVAAAVVAAGLAGTGPELQAPRARIVAPPRATRRRAAKNLIGVTPRRAPIYIGRQIQRARPVATHHTPIVKPVASTSHADLRTGHPLRLSSWRSGLQRGQSSSGPYRFNMRVQTASPRFGPVPRGAASRLRLVHAAAALEEACQVSADGLGAESRGGWPPALATLPRAERAAPPAVARSAGAGRSRAPCLAVAAQFARSEVDHPERRRLLS
jgi:hypothetical protein